MSKLLAEASESEGAHTLHRVLGPWSLTALGIGAIIGAGIFVLTGEAAYRHAGPAVTLSFVAAGLACVFAALCYAEFASLIPIAGSAYTYGYATLGELFAWIIGWDLVLEYALAASTVSAGWTGYFVSLLSNFGISVPASISTPMYVIDPQGQWVNTGSLNLVAVSIVLVLSVVLALGIKESATTNTVIVFIKTGIVLLFIFTGVWYINTDNWTPYIPPNTGEFGAYGWSGILRGAALVFFAYIGFDAVSTAAQETKNPKRDLPIGILTSLVVCTALYIAVSAILTGLVKYTELGVPHPISVGIQATPFPWLGPFVDLGAVMGLASVMLVMLLGQSRIFYAMSRDGLLPPIFSRIHPRFRTPFVPQLVIGAVVSIPAALFPITALGHMVNIGTLLAFVIVCASVIVLRVRQPDLPRPFKVPGYPVVPALGVLCSFALMLFLPLETWERLFIWLALGMAIYFLWGRRHSKVGALADVTMKTPGD
ncbi:MAG: amino acid permease [Bryobacteraceae bacterium]|nr:amino acid permease [Bryobacteraceae bacterium]